VRLISSTMRVGWSVVVVSTLKTPSFNLTSLGFFEFSAFKSDLNAASILLTSFLAREEDGDRGGDPPVGRGVDEILSDGRGRIGDLLTGGDTAVPVSWGRGRGGVPRKGLGGVREGRSEGEPLGATEWAR